MNLTKMNTNKHGEEFVPDKKIKQSGAYILKISPAIPVRDRHRIMHFLSKLGYAIHRSGEYADFSACEIEFSFLFFSDVYDQTINIDDKKDAEAIFDEADDGEGY